jgi:small multidrug resistance pump
MGYGLLAAAIAAEVAGTTAMKFSQGFTRLWPSLITVVGYGLAFVLLAQTLKTLSVSTAYAIWAGIGTAAVAAIGMLFLGEGAGPAKIVGILLVVVGVIVLNLGGAHRWHRAGDTTPAVGSGSSRPRYEWPSATESHGSAIARSRPRRMCRSARRPTTSPPWTNC